MESARLGVGRDRSLDAQPLLEALGAVAAAGDLDEAMRRTAAAAASLTAAEYAVVAVSDGGRLVDLVTHGDVPDDLPMPRNRPASGERLVVEPPGGARIQVGRTTPFAAMAERRLELLGETVAPLLARARALDVSERRRVWLEATAAVVTAVAPARTLADALEALTTTLRQVTGAGLVAALGRDDHTVLAATGTVEVEALAEPLGAAEATGELARVSRGDGVAVIVPLPTVHAPVGVLLLEQAGSWAILRELERDLLRDFAAQAADALDHVQAVEAREELLVAGERDRIARDLHDLVVQRLYALGMQLQGARAGGPERLGAVVDGAVKELDQAIRDVRATIFELGRGTGPSLQEEARALVEEYAGVLGFAPSLRYTGPVDTTLVKEVADQVLLTLREALSNVARHARAATTRVELNASGDWFMLRVTDDGVGLPTEVAPGNGLGNARHRAEKLGGVMRLTPAGPRGGTSLVWLVPTSR